eukprot:TRINITY_DN787_c0_g1_i4.p1 TRINITY_DN787_c0_g1~~TRINITY_DN787_c0_g1_i4.p1  ORF type:complete len:350 (+),score=94.12 TRINITY_DN787_c0_g1_i4:162-1211(+)
MEKYRRFADAGTGINPFVPVSGEVVKPSLVYKVLVYALGPFLALIRAFFIVPLLVFLIAFEKLIKPLLFVNVIARGVTLYVNILVFRLILLFLGFIRFSTNLQVLSRPNNPQMPRMNSGYVVFSNHVSPIDVLYLQYLLSPRFVRIVYKTEEASEPLLSPLSLWEAIRFAFDLRWKLPIAGTEKELAQVPLPKVRVQTLLDQQHEEQRGPVVIFFEGGITNGKAVLNLEDALIDKVQTYCRSKSRNPTFFCFKYDGNRYSPINTTRNPLLHLVRMMMEPVNHVQVYADSTLDANQRLRSFAEELYTRKLNLPILKTRWTEYKGFLEYWDQTHSAAYKGSGSTKAKDKRE